jgi:hypothetical protein
MSHRYCPNVGQTDSIVYNIRRRLASSHKLRELTGGTFLWEAKRESVASPVTHPVGVGQPVARTVFGFDSGRSSFTNVLAGTVSEFALRVNRREDFVDVSSVHFGAFQGRDASVVEINCYPSFVIHALKYSMQRRKINHSSPQLDDVVEITV